MKSSAANDSLPPFDSPYHCRVMGDYILARLRSDPNLREIAGAVTVLNGSAHVTMVELVERCSRSARSMIYEVWLYNYVSAIQMEAINLHPLWTEALYTYAGLDVETGGRSIQELGTDASEAIAEARWHLYGEGPSWRYESDVEWVDDGLNEQVDAPDGDCE